MNGRVVALESVTGVGVANEGVSAAASGDRKRGVF